jgi:putative ABC transport system permease protein
VQVEPRITTGVTVTVGEEIGDVFGLAVGARESYFRERMQVKEKLVAGSWFTGGEDEIIAGAKVVELANAKVGDEMLLLGTTQDGSLSPIKGRLIGIVKMGSMLDRQVFVPLEKIQYLTDIPGGATELLVYGARYRDAGQLAAELRALPELRDYEVQLFSEREPWKSMGGTVRAMQTIIILVVVFLAALGIWNTMMMSVLERTHEVGVLRAMGLSRVGTVLLFVGEALAIGTAGGLIGIGLGAYPSWLLESEGVRIGEQMAANSPVVMSETIRGDLSLEAVAIAFGLGMLMAALGSVVPALRAAMIQPVSAMRSGR